MFDMMLPVKAKFIPLVGWSPHLGCMLLSEIQINAGQKNLSRTEVCKSIYQCFWSVDSPVGTSEKKRITGELR
jgi:hypothetical protein